MTNIVESNAGETSGTVRAKIAKLAGFPVDVKHILAPTITPGGTVARIDIGIAKLPCENFTPIIAKC